MDIERRFSIGAWIIEAVVFGAILILALCLAGCNEEACRPTAWMLAGTDMSAGNSYVGRVGVRSPEGIEFGASSDWLDGGDYQAYGAYALMEIPFLADANLPLIGTNYIGAAAGLTVDTDMEDDVGFWGFLTGVTVPVRDNLDSVIEYRYTEFSGNFEERFPDENDAHTVYAGLRFKV